MFFMFGFFSGSFFDKNGQEKIETDNQVKHENKKCWAIKTKTSNDLDVETMYSFMTK